MTKRQRRIRKHGAKHERGVIGWIKNDWSSYGICKWNFGTGKMRSDS